MSKRAALVFLIFFQIQLVRAQSVSDSSAGPDTATVQNFQNDTTIQAPVVKKRIKAIADTLVNYYTDSLRYSSVKLVETGRIPLTQADLLRFHPYFNFYGKAIHIRSDQFERPSYDGIFYLLVLMLFYFAIVRLFFSKYLSNLMTLFFRASMRQQQLREQVLQAPFPSLLLNMLFIFSGGLYGAFLLKYYHYGRLGQFWLHFLYCAVFLAVLYLLKYIILRVTGWIFNISRGVEAYLFIVFMTNKMIGIFLLPFLLLISFSGSLITDVCITLSYAMIGLFYIYRIIGGYATWRKEIKISGLYFFLYLCAFEMAPLLLIYKVLLTYLEKAY